MRMAKHRGNYSISQNTSLPDRAQLNLHKLLSWFVRRKPTDVNNFIVLIQVANWHGHIVVRGYDLKKILSIRPGLRKEKN